MIARFLARIFGTQNERELKRLWPIVKEINSYEPTMQQLSDEELAAKTDEFRQRLSQGTTLDELLPEAYAVVRETARRKVGLRHFDVQLLGGVVLHKNAIAEMKTGEGKTLVATLPLYLNALSGKGAHLITVNDYLARRDAEWMGPIYHHLGLSVGVLQHMMSDAQRKEVYNCDILYATNNELGFDYLRDNMKFRIEDYVQRSLNYAIVDEVDSILIDEARTPLIISGPGEESSELYQQADRVVSRMQKNVDYELEEKERQVMLTEEGTDKVEQAFQLQNLYSVDNLKMLHHINQALKAHALFRNDVDYVVRDDKVMIVDEFTGRILEGRRYSDGLHQAIEAKENVPVQAENQTLAQITLQNFFRLYNKLAGMTGTAATEAEEFHSIYSLDVVCIPTHEPLIREDKSDLIFLNKKAKYKAIVEDIQERYKKGQPVLIGTTAIETSEYLSNILTSSGIPHEVLNAKHHEREAEIIEHAGKPYSITIATNMAGRGTDIKLTPESVQAGGLYILGTERHESRRIDNQLRGRAGRQGDPGESRFYISLEDDLIRRFAGGQLKQYMEAMGMQEDEVIEHKWISSSIENAQQKVEKRNFEVRKHLLEYDDVLNQQRKVVYEYRKSVLEGSEQITTIAQELIAAAIAEIVSQHTMQRALTDESFRDCILATARLIGMSEQELLDRSEITQENTNADQLRKDLINFLQLRYQHYTHYCPEDLTEEECQKRIETMYEAQKWLILESIDQAWKQHMVNLDAIKEGIGLRGWGQKNPLIEYKKEAYAAFQDMMYNTRWEIVHYLFHINLETFDKHAIESRRERELSQIRTSADDTSSQEPEQRMSREERRKAQRKKHKGKK